MQDPFEILDNAGTAKTNATDPFDILDKYNGAPQVVNQPQSPILREPTMLERAPGAMWEATGIPSTGRTVSSLTEGHAPALGDVLGTAGLVAMPFIGGGRLAFQGAKEAGYGPMMALLKGGARTAADIGKVATGTGISEAALGPTAREKSAQLQAAYPDSQLAKFGGMALEMAPGVLGGLAGYKAMNANPIATAFKRGEPEAKALLGEYSKMAGAEEPVLPKYSGEDLEKGLQNIRNQAGKRLGDVKKQAAKMVGERDTLGIGLAKALEKSRGAMDLARAEGVPALTGAPDEVAQIQNWIASARNAKSLPDISGLKETISSASAPNLLEKMFGTGEKKYLPEAGAIAQKYLMDQTPKSLRPAFENENRIYSSVSKLGEMIKDSTTEKGVDMPKFVQKWNYLSDAQKSKMFPEPEQRQAIENMFDQKNKSLLGKIVDKLKFYEYMPIFGGMKAKVTTSIPSMLEGAEVPVNPGARMFNVAQTQPSGLGRLLSAGMGANAGEQTAQPIMDQAGFPLRQRYRMNLAQ